MRAPPADWSVAAGSPPRGLELELQLEPQRSDVAVPGAGEVANEHGDVVRPRSR
jgi:hypothetical protein